MLKQCKHLHFFLQSVCSNKNEKTMTDKVCDLSEIVHNSNLSYIWRWWFIEYNCVFQFLKLTIQTWTVILLQKCVFFSCHIISIVWSKYIFIYFYIILYEIIFLTIIKITCLVVFIFVIFQVFFFLMETNIF